MRTSIGIDIGQDRISLVYLKSSGKRPRVEGYAVYPVDEEKKSAAAFDHLSLLIQEFMREKKIPASEIYLGVGRDSVLMRFIELPLSVKENLRETLGYEIDKYVPFPGEDACFDFQVVSEDKDNGRMRVLLAAVKREAVKPFWADGNAGGRLFSGIEFSSSALANVFLQEAEPGGQAPLAFLYADRHHPELNLVEGRRLTFSRVFARTKDGSFPLNAVRDGIEALQKEVGAPPEEGGIPLVVTGDDEEAVQGLLSGGNVGAFAVRGLDLGATGLPSSDLLPAYGLALKGLGPVPVDVNLLPEIHRKKASRTGLYVCGALAAIAVVLAVAWGVGSWYQERQYLDKLENAGIQLEAEVERIRKLEMEYQDLKKRIDYLNSLRAGDVQVLEILRELTRLIPETAWLRRFTYSETGVEIEGYADAASELIPLLEESPLFKDVTFLSGITKSRDGKETFRIGLKIG